MECRISWKFPEREVVGLGAGILEVRACFLVREFIRCCPLEPCILERQSWVFQSQLCTPLMCALMKQPRQHSTNLPNAIRGHVKVQHFYLTTRWHHAKDGTLKFVSSCCLLPPLPGTCSGCGPAPTLFDDSASHPSPFGVIPRRRYYSGHWLPLGGSVEMEATDTVVAWHSAEDTAPTFHQSWWVTAMTQIYQIQPLPMPRSSSWQQKPCLAWSMDVVLCRFTGLVQ